MNRNSSLIRYFERVLGLRRVGSDMMVEVRPVAITAAVSSPSFENPFRRRVCFLIDARDEGSSETAPPSLREMASKLHMAIRAEWVKHGCSDLIEVEWAPPQLADSLNLLERDPSAVMAIVFGSNSASARPEFAVLAPGLVEIHENPALKKDLWRRLQQEIAKRAEESRSAANVLRH